MSLIDFIGASDEKNINWMSGVAVGIVTNNHDPEQMGRVRIRLPWRKNDDQTYWARVATLMAGNGRGSFFLPEKDDEVLVAFEHGDLNHPFVIGALWNGEDKPPETNRDGKNNIKKFTSRSGHEILFDDENEREKVVIHTKAGHTVLLDDSSGAEKIEIRDKTGSNKILIDSVQNAITFEAVKIEMEAKDSIALKANGELTIRGYPVYIN
jgi:uncharacterized protein involved in type VI secretion and phage assembly